MFPIIIAICDASERFILSKGSKLSFNQRQISIISQINDLKDGNENSPVTNIQITEMTGFLGGKKFNQLNSPSEKSVHHNRLFLYQITPWYGRNLIWYF